MLLYILDIEPMDAEPIALDPLDREPSLLSRSTKSVTCSKPIVNNDGAIMNLILTGSEYNDPIYHRYRVINARSIALDPLEREPI